MKLTMGQKSTFDATKITDVTSLLEIGERAFKTGTYYISIDCYNQAIKMDKRCEKAYIRRAILRSIYDDRVGGLNDLRKAWNINSNTDETYYYIGALLNAEQRYEEAIPFFDKAINLNGIFLPVAHHGKAFALFYLQEYDRVIQECNQAIEESEIRWASLSLRGQAYMKKEKFEEALDDLNRALELNPQDSFSLLKKGEALLRQQNHKEATDVFDRLEQLIGKTADIANYRGVVEILRGNPSTAVVEFSKGIDLGLTSIALYLNRAMAKDKLENYLGAEIDLLKAIELDPTNGEHHLALGRIYLKRKQVDQACLSFNRAGELGCKEAYDEIREHCNQ